MTFDWERPLVPDKLELNKGSGLNSCATLGKFAHFIAQTIDDVNGAACTKLQCKRPHLQEQNIFLFT